MSLQLVSSMDVKHWFYYFLLQRKYSTGISRCTPSIVLYFVIEYTTRVPVVLCSKNSVLSSSKNLTSMVVISQAPGIKTNREFNFLVN